MDRAQQWKWSRSDNPRDNHHHRGFEGSPGAVLGFSWPPRSYCCNFCGREFRSAQALGGHMNVHRRDRALLGNPNPNPNPNSNPNSLSSPKLSLKYAFPSFLSSPQAFLSPSTCEEGLPPSSSSSPKLVDNSRIGEEELIRKKRDCASLPSLFHGSSMNRNQREHGDAGGVLLTRFGVEMPGDSSVEELDLELRLGCKSN